MRTAVILEYLDLHIAKRADMWLLHWVRIQQHIDYNHMHLYQAYFCQPHLAATAHITPGFYRQTTKNTSLSNDTTQHLIPVARPEQPKPDPKKIPKKRNDAHLLFTSLKGGSWARPGKGL